MALLGGVLHIAGIAYLGIFILDVAANTDTDADADIDIDRDGVDVVDVNGVLAGVDLGHGGLNTRSRVNPIEGFV